MQTTWFRIRILAMVLLPLGAAASPVLAQQEQLHGLLPVEQRVADNGPLSTSLKWVQYGLREPYSFSELYQLPVGQKSYVRRNAGLWAVFPRSLYMPSEEGVVASVPAGTMYYIGGPAEVLPSIANQQAAYVPVGQMPADRVENSRLEAALIDRRIPASSIQSNMDGQEASLRLAPVVAKKPVVVERQQTVDPEIAARAAWVASMPTLDFVKQLHYRRDCLKKVMGSVNGSAVSEDAPVPADTEHAEAGTTP